MPALSAARLARLMAFSALRRAASRSASNGLGGGLSLAWKPDPGLNPVERLSDPPERS